MSLSFLTVQRFSSNPAEWGTWPSVCSQKPQVRINGFCFKGGVEMRKPRVLLAALGLFLAAGWAWAQGTTSGLTGTVTSNGKPLQGVTVTVSSPSLQGTRNTTTGTNGVYNFGALPPGDYSITFEHEVLQTVTRKQRLLLVETSRADVDLAVSNVKEEVTVSGQPVTAAVFET